MTLCAARVSRRTMLTTTICAQRLERSTAGFAGVAGSGDLAGVGFEVLEADTGAAPDQCAFPDFGGVDAQDQGQPSRPGVHAGLEEHPLHAVPSRARTTRAG